MKSMTVQITTQCGGTYRRHLKRTRRQAINQHGVWSCWVHCFTLNMEHICSFETSGSALEPKMACSEIHNSVYVTVGKYVL
jgi:hypothetical protein